MKTIIITLCMGFFFAAAANAVFLLQNYNQTQNNYISTTAAPGYHWELSGTIEDLAQFSGSANPFGFTNWMGHSSVTVVDGVLHLTPNVATEARIFNASTTAYPYYSEATYRYLELTVSREFVAGSGRFYYRKDGNSIATSGQNGTWSWSNDDINPGDIQTVLLDLQELNAWGNGSLTAIGFELQAGVAGSKVGTTNHIYSIRLGSDIAAIPEPSTYGLAVSLLVLGTVALRRRFNRHSLND
jgi:hypothetical protein